MSVIKEMILFGAGLMITVSLAIISFNIYERAAEMGKGIAESPGAIHTALFGLAPLIPPMLPVHLLEDGDQVTYAYHRDPPKRQ